MAGEQGAQSGASRLEHGRRGHATGRKFAQYGRNDGLVGGLGRGGQDRDGVVTIQRGGQGAGEFGAGGVGGAAEDASKDGTRIGTRRSGRGGLGPRVREVGLGAEQQHARGGVERRRTHGAEGSQADASISVVQRLGVDVGREFGTARLGDEEGVLAHGRIGIAAKGAKETVFKTIESLQCPERLDAGFGLGVAADEGHERTDGGGEQAGIFVHQDAHGVEADVLVGMIESRDESRHVCLG